MIATNEVATAPAIVNSIYEVTEKLRKAGHEVVPFKFDELPQLKDNLLRFKDMK